MMSETDNAKAEPAEDSAVDGKASGPQSRAAAPAEAPPADFASLKAGLPDDIRDDPALDPFTSFEGIARSLVNAQALVGKRVEEMTADQLAAVHSRHGRPETPDGYQLSRPEDMPKGMNYSEDLERAARSWFHEAGLSQVQAEELFAKWNGYAAEKFNGFAHARQAATEDGVKALRAELGPAFDRKVKLAGRAVRQFGGKELQKFLDDTGLGNDPKLVRAFISIAEKVGEDTVIGDGGDSFAMTADEARKGIARIMAEPAYFNANHPEHDAKVAEAQRLFQLAHPEPGAG